MKKYLLILAAILLLWGCIAEDRTECTNPRGVFVSLTVRPERMSSVTRSADETAIRDLNLYLYDDNGNVVLHRYQTSATLRFECLPGDYRMCIAANLGRDLGDNLLWEDFTVTHADKYDVLPMAYEGDITIIPSADGMLTLPAVEVQRCVSKISYRITVAPAVADIELRSVQLFSVPRSVSVFDMAAAPSDDPDDYTDCPEVGLSGQQAAGDCYLLPNMQGVVATITDQRQKNPENAPANASYLLIRAVRGSKILAYYIYLGGNNTSDFNVRANMHSRLNISILGDSEVDTRISSYAVNVHDTYEENSVGGYCTYNPFQMLAVEIDGSPAPLTLRGRIGVAQGNAGAFCLNGSPVGEGRDLTLPEQPGPNVFGVNYAPGIYTTVNSQVVYTVTVEDDAGFTQSFDIGHRFANRLDVYIHPATAENGNGTVTVAGALYDAETSSLTHDRVVLCHEKGCTLTAVPEAGYRFEGWYSAADYKTRLSTSASYAYIPTSPEAAIFPKFTANTRPLDDEGTANCYIAPELNTSYSFDATTMGNGRATTNIVPKRLAGAEAKVLWETGTTRGAIVESAELTGDGRIVFRTGMTCGNAVIGLLDSRGVCIWSWHIWSVDYEIEATAQTYASGAVFMDRNLGALATDCTQAAAKGLYYQWGRKDPFSYPALATDAYTQAPTVYAPGFEYAESNPRTSGTESPYDVMTLEWATAHPTTYMDGVFYEDWEEWTSVADWLYVHHPNLWGNVTTGKNNISRTSHKSIYDPCPPGWKVPGAEDFAGIERIGVSAPYYVTIRCNSTQTAKIPLGGTFYEGRYDRNGSLGRLYTNAPYYGELRITQIFEDKIIREVLSKSPGALKQDDKNYVWNLTEEERTGNRFANMNVLGDFCYISKGMVVNANENTEKGAFRKEDLISDSLDAIHCRKYIEAKDIDKYQVKRVRYLEWNTERCPDKLSRPTFRELYDRPKLIMNCLGTINVTIDTEEHFLHNHSIYCAVLWKDLKDVINKSISSSVKKFCKHKRLVMESMSKEVDLYYLLGILNSSMADQLLADQRGGDYHIYPEHIRNLPIPVPQRETQDAIGKIAKEILHRRETNTDYSELEEQINRLVAVLYQ